MIPLLIALAPGIVKVVEKLSKGTKLQTAVAALKPIAENMATAGTLGGPVPDDATLASIVEVVVQDLKRRGELDGEKPAPVSGNVVLAKPGDQITLTLLIRS